MCVSLSTSDGLLFCIACGVCATLLVRELAELDVQGLHDWRCFESDVAGRSCSCLRSRRGSKKKKKEKLRR